MDMRGALQVAGLTRSREAAKGNAGEFSVFSFQFSVFSFQFSVFSFQWTVDSGQ
jgi:hypothetical protein